MTLCFVGRSRRTEGIDQVGMMGFFLRYEGRVSAPLQYRLLRCSGCIEGLVARSRRSKSPRRGSLEGSTAPPGVKEGAPGGLAGRNGLSGRSGWVEGLLVEVRLNRQKVLDISDRNGDWSGSGGQN
jgi:hypothetical protein